MHYLGNRLFDFIYLFTSVLFFNLPIQFSCFIYFLLTNLHKNLHEQMGFGKDHGQNHRDSLAPPPPTSYIAEGWLKENR